MKSRVGKAIKLLGSILFILGVLFLAFGLFGAYYERGIEGLLVLLDFTKIETLLSFALALLPGYILYRVGCMIANCKREGEEVEEASDESQGELDAKHG